MGKYYMANAYYRTFWKNSVKNVNSKLVNKFKKGSDSIRHNG